MSMVQEIDYGTKAVTAPMSLAATVTLTIDGRDVTVPEGTSIMRASMEAGDQGPQAVCHRYRWTASAVAGCAWSRSRAAAARRRPAPPRSRRA